MIMILVNANLMSKHLKIKKCHAITIVHIFSSSNHFSDCANTLDLQVCVRKEKNLSEQTQRKQPEREIVSTKTKVF